MALSFNGKQIAVQICQVKAYKPNTPPALSYKIESEGYDCSWILCNPETGREEPQDVINWPPKRNTSKNLAKFLYQQLHDHITENRRHAVDYWLFAKEDIEELEAAKNNLINYPDDELASSTAIQAKTKGKKGRRNLPFFVPSSAETSTHSSGIYLLFLSTATAKSLPALNLATLFAGMSKGSLVLGLRPVRALL